MNKKNTKKKNNPKKKIYNKKIIIPLIIFLLLVVGLIAYYFINKNSNNEFVIGEKLNISNPSDYLIQYDNGDYYLMKANADIKFNVSSKDKKIKYEVLDENNKKIETKVSKKKDNYVISSIKDYEAGKTYKLILENASFTDERLKDIKTLYFTIVRPNSNTQVLNKDVIKANKDTITNIKRDDNYYTITSNKEFNKGDIVYYKNENQVIAFKIDTIKKDKNNYIINTTAPALNEIFKELDIYGEFNLDLNDFITNEELKKYIEVAIVEDGLLDNIIPNVKADEIFNVDIKPQRDGSAKVNVSLNLNHGEKSVFKDALENHDIKLDIELTIKLKAHSDITFSKQDIGASIDIDVNSDFNINPTDDSFSLFEKEINDNEDVNVTIARQKLDDLEMDTSNEEKPLVKSVIPTPIPGLTANLDVDFLKELELALKSSLVMNGNINIKFGYNNKGFYKDFNIKVKDNSYDILGKANLKVGLDPKVNVNFCGVMETGIKAPLGIYLDGQLNYMKSSNKDELDGNIEFGAFVNAGLYANFHIYKLELAKAEATYEKKIPIAKLEGTIKDECEEKLLKGDFSCYVGTYSTPDEHIAGQESKDIIIDKNGIKGRKYSEISKEDDGTYKIVYKDIINEITGSPWHYEYYLVPIGVEHNYPLCANGSQELTESDTTKVRIVFHGIVEACGGAWYKN